MIFKDKTFCVSEDCTGTLVWTGYFCEGDES